MRVCYVIGTYPLVTTTFVDREIRALRRLGIDIQVLAVREPARDAPLSEQQRELQRDVTYLLPISWRECMWSHLLFALRRPYRYVTTLLRVVSRPHPSLRAHAKTVLHFGEGVCAARLVRRRDLDEVHAHFADRAATIALVASRMLDIPYSLSVHAGADLFVDPILLSEKVRSARQVLTCTAQNKRRLTATVGHDVSAKITVVAHGVELYSYRPGSRSVSQRVRILGVGQLKERKGFAYLVAACGALRASGYQFSCHIVGDGPQRGALQALVDGSGLNDTVALLGALPHDHVMREYERASMFVLPCLEANDGDVDGIPNVLIEAMASGVPVVSTDLPAIRELVSDGVNGVLVAPGDVDELVRALARLLDDPAHRAALAACGRRTIVENFDSDINARRFAATLWPEQFATATDSRRQ